MNRPPLEDLIQKFFLLFILVFPLDAQDSELDPKSNVFAQNKTPSVIRFTLDEAVKYVLENNLTVQNAKYELIKADANFLKNESQYSWKFLANFQSNHNYLPVNRNNIRSGTRRDTDTIQAGFEKQFMTGTYVKFLAGTVRYDTNAYENAGSAPSLFSFLAIPPQYTGSLAVTLSQELLKNAFGQVDENKKDILRTQTVITRDQVMDQLAHTVVEVMMQYWSLSIYDYNVENLQRRLNNVQRIRNITARKENFGLAERYEVFQWDAILHETENQVIQATLDRGNAERDLIRILNVDPRTKIAGITNLETSMPSGELESEIKFALENRIDMANLKKQLDIANLELENSVINDRPSLKVTASYATQGQNINSPWSNLYNYNQGVLSFKYPKESFGMNLTYPLWDKGLKGAIRDSKIKIETLKNQIKDLKLQIENEVRDNHGKLEKDYKVLEAALREQREANRYYQGIERQFSRSLANAVTVKNALDGVIQADQKVTKAQIDFNISLLEYDLSRNAIFDRFDISKEKLFERITKAAKELMESNK